MRLVTLKRRSEFQRVRGGIRASRAALLIELKRRSQGSAHEPHDQSDGPRFGLTLTKKLGAAVERNRVRRRLKSALRELDTQALVADGDYVIVVREPAVNMPYAALKRELAAALAHVHRDARSIEHNPRRRQRQKREDGVEPTINITTPEPTTDPSKIENSPPPRPLRD